MPGKFALRPWNDYFMELLQCPKRAGFSYPHFKHRVTLDSLWIHGSSTPSWAFQELRRSGLPYCSHENACVHYQKITHFDSIPSDDGKSTTFVACIHNQKIIHSDSIRSDDERSTTFVTLLRACAKYRDLSRGIRIHNDALRCGLLDKCADALVTMYAKCGELVKAKELLDAHKCRDVFSWTDLIQGYSQKGRCQDALDCFEQMLRESVSPDAVTFACSLKACGSIRAIDVGKQIHDKIANQGLLRKDIILGNALVDMYAKCGALVQAQQVLDELPVRDVVSWSALIAGYAQHDQAEQALICFERMQGEGLFPNAVTFACILKACGTIGMVHKGEEVHDEIARQGLLENNAVLGNALVHMYIKCGAFEKAHKILEKLPIQIAASWNALMAEYIQHGQADQAMECYDQMQQNQGVVSDRVTFLCIVKACGSVRSVEKAKKVHDHIARTGLLEKDIILGNAVVDMYAKCGDLTKAHSVLEELPVRKVVSWNTLIAGYTQHGQAEKALKCFEQMQKEGLAPDAVTFACALKICGSLKSAGKGEQIHIEIDRQGLLDVDVFLGSSLVDMYAKCGCLSKAQQVLEKLPVQDVVSWSALITGYNQGGQGEQALDCFESMQRKGLSPNSVTFLCILKACGSVGAVDRGKLIHNEIVRQGLLKNNDLLGNALVDMYVKCGAFAKAQQMLEELPIQNIVSWNTLIAGYAHCGQGEQALICVENIREKNLTPDGVTLLCILKACGTMGLIDKAVKYFVNLSRDYGIKPDLDHYTCLIDVLGRAGHLDKAIGIIQKMSSVDYPMALWSAFLCACHKWGDIKVGRWAFEHAVHLEKSDAAAYVFMVDMYKAAGMQEDAANIEAIREQNINEVST